MVQVTVKPEVTKPTGPAKQRARVVSLTSEFLIATVVSTSSIQGRKKSGRVKTSVGRPHKRMGWFPMLKVSVRPDSSSWRTTSAFAPNPDKLGGAQWVDATPAQSPLDSLRGESQFNAVLF